MHALLIGDAVKGYPLYLGSLAARSRSLLLGSLAFGATQVCCSGSQSAAIESAR